MAEDKGHYPHTSVWLRPPRESRTERRSGGRGSQAPAGLSRDRIVRAAVRLLDADGLAAFSMRRLAADLGVTPMSVYWYVDNKDDLLELALDEVLADMALPEVPDGPPDPDPDRADHDWPQQLRALAREWRRVLVAHPWATRLHGTYLNLGPRSARFSRTAIAVIARSGLPPEQYAGALSLVFQFIYGFATTEGHWRERARLTGATEDELYEIAYDTAVRTDAGLVLHAELVQPRRTEGVGAVRERDFEHALDCAVLGIHAMVTAARLTAEAGGRAGAAGPARTAPR
ncbi:TetR/AcrR family transcriptional regulator [Peterkaempfera bronchialis]|uniref:TetR/AcrR family transcriptional regulator n=1 Tax=Peterkaempfera bronchialis TaxID=2126346 RepID=A0A345SS81_9ACTN|nr:TetR/AcrR family transcriptional regulator C-terminal domain-containing protein [Peterkaempfera bronchialis]AXI76586.1 TetR/AcrR family transcriptional regulator [Peterkaempfera bronchialis]